MTVFARELNGKAKSCFQRDLLSKTFVNSMKFA